MQKSIDALRDIFYSTQKSLFTLFRTAVGSNGKFIELDRFLQLVTYTSGDSFPHEEAQLVYKSMVANGKITFA